MNSKTTSRKLSGNIVLQSVLDEKILEVYSALRANRLSKVWLTNLKTNTVR